VEHRYVAQRPQRTTWQPRRQGQCRLVPRHAHRSSSRPVIAMYYFMLFVVIQICGAPFTPAFSIAALSSGAAAKAFAFSTLWKS
jgi:hypothetical protein